jgi:uncharacterized membrane protein
MEWAAIGLCAAVTYGLRLGGLLLASRLPESGRIKRAMDALPGAILLALVAPSVAGAGLWGFLGAGLTALLVRVTGNVFLAMAAGVGVVAAARQMGL